MGILLHYWVLVDVVVCDASLYFLLLQLLLLRSLLFDLFTTAAATAAVAAGTAAVAAGTAAVAAAAAVVADVV